jgi:hypothetical protein
MRRGTRTALTVILLSVLVATGIVVIIVIIPAKELTMNDIKVWEQQHGKAAADDIKLWEEKYGTESAPPSPGPGAGTAK